MRYSVVYDIRKQLPIDGHQVRFKVLDSDTKIHVKPKITVQSVAIKSETQMGPQWFLGGITNTTIKICTLKLKLILLRVKLTLNPFCCIAVNGCYKNIRDLRNCQFRLIEFKWFIIHE